MSKDQQGIQINFRISPDLAQRLAQHSAETGVPKAKILRRGLEDILERGYPRGNPRQAAKDALGILDESPGALGREIVPEGIASESRPKRDKDSPPQADAPKDGGGNQVERTSAVFPIPPKRNKGLACPMPDGGTLPTPERIVTADATGLSCPAPGCTFRATSPAAVCPTHGRKVR